MNNKRHPMKRAELKPCPFCGSKCKYLQSALIPTYTIGIRCNKCKAETQFYDKEENRVIGYKKITRRFNKRQ